MASASKLSNRRRSCAFPAASKVVGVADSTSETAGAALAGVVVEDGSDTNGCGAFGGVPWAVAVFATLPASTSAWVTV